MKMIGSATFRIVALLVALAAVFVMPVAASEPEADFEIPNGWFYSQTGPGDGTGFAVTDDDGIPYWTEFQQLGGISALGYPVSRRFIYKDFTNQAFQKAILQWQPESQSMNFLNIFDELSAAGRDTELRDTMLTPPSRDWSGDVGLPWEDVVQRHLALLDENPAIRNKFRVDPDWLNHYGLPMGYEDLGDVRVLRAQRAVFQQWMIDVPWASAGEVVIANGGDIAKELGLVPADAGAPHRADETPAVVPEATPDAKAGRISFDSNRDGNWEIYVMNPDGTDQTRLTSTDAEEAFTSWSPDGSRITFARRRAGNWDIWVMNADGTSQTQLTNHPGTDGKPRWSPDGSKIAFESSRSGTFQICVMNVDGTDQTCFASTGGLPSTDQMASWSPDGGKIVFARGLIVAGELLRATIWIMNADGSGQTRLTNSSILILDGSTIHVVSNFDTEPAWSPDGRKIVFQSDRLFFRQDIEGRDLNLYLINADGSGDEIQLTDHQGADVQPSWSPDGASIAFSSDRDGDMEIYLMNADGSGVTQLTTNTASDIYPRW